MKRPQLSDKTGFHDGPPKQWAQIHIRSSWRVWRRWVGASPIACAVVGGAWLLANHRARRYGGIEVDIIEYNTGVIFFTKAAKLIFRIWKERVRDIDSSINFVLDGQQGHMSLNDQAGFAVAVEEVGAQPFILPHNWNFRPKWQKSWYGPLVIWHDYSEPPASLLSHNITQFDPTQILLSSSLN